MKGNERKGSGASSFCPESSHFRGRGDSSRPRWTLMGLRMKPSPGDQRAAALLPGPRRSGCLCGPCKRPAATGSLALPRPRAASSHPPALWSPPQEEAASGSARTASQAGRLVPLPAPGWGQEEPPLSWKRSLPPRAFEVAGRPQEEPCTCLVHVRVPWE